MQVKNARQEQQEAREKAEGQLMAAKAEVKYMDFDEFFAENDDEARPVEFTYKGRKYYTTAEIPMSVIMLVGELGGQEMSQKSMGKIGNIFGDIIGKENWAQIIDDGITMNRALKILSWIMDTSMAGHTEQVGELDEDGEEGKAKASPSTSGSTNISSIGENSKQISGGFTTFEGEASSE